jgi:hypothetical protein
MYIKGLTSGTGERLFRHGVVLRISMAGGINVPVLTVLIPSSVKDKAEAASLESEMKGKK